MLVTMKEIVDVADKEGYCVPAPNYQHVMMMYKAVEAAEEANSPLILDIGRHGLDAESRRKFIDLCSASRAAAEAASVPVCINLDHGGEYDLIVQCMFDGLTSVMVDRSYLSYEENVAQVAELTKVAHALGISVEAELGHVGNNVVEGVENTGHNAAITSEEDKRKFYTNPDQAVDYVAATGIDCLAVAVGTVHGAYPAGFEPSIDFELLAELFEKVPVPLVLHGGSGTGDEILSKLGPYASKLNVGTDLFRAWAEGVADASAKGGDPAAEGTERYVAVLKHYMEVLGSAGKAE